MEPEENVLSSYKSPPLINPPGHPHLIYTSGKPHSPQIPWSLLSEDKSPWRSLISLHLHCQESSTKPKKDPGLRVRDLQ